MGITSSVIACMGLGLSQSWNTSKIALYSPFYAFRKSPLFFSIWFFNSISLGKWAQLNVFSLDNTTSFFLAKCSSLQVYLSPPMAPYWLVCISSQWMQGLSCAPSPFQLWTSPCCSLQAAPSQDGPYLAVQSVSDDSRCCTAGEILVIFQLISIPPHT